MVVHVLGAFFYIVVVVVLRSCLNLWVMTPLVVGMLTVNAMQMARLVELTVLREGLAINTRVLVAGARTSFEAATIAVASRPAVDSRPAIALVMPRTAVVALSAFREPLELLPVTFFELVAKLALGSRTKLLVVLALDQAIAETSKKILSKYLVRVCSVLSLSLRLLQTYSV